MKLQDCMQKKCIVIWMVLCTIPLLVLQYNRIKEPCEFNCEKEWINDRNNLKVIKDRQKSPQTDNFLATTVKFLGENKIVEVVTDKPWEEEIPRDESCSATLSS